MDFEVNYIQSRWMREDSALKFTCIHLLLRPAAIAATIARLGHKHRVFTREQIDPPHRGPLVLIFNFQILLFAITTVVK
jgi:hypothetical protein